MVKKQANNGFFEKPGKYFSQISNQILRDTNLSLKAKGLYSLIASYITLPDFTLYKNYLMSQCLEGRCAFDAAWKELVSAGYLLHTRIRLEDGTFLYRYILKALPTNLTNSKPLYRKKRSSKNVASFSKQGNDTQNLPTNNPVSENQLPVSIYNNNKNNNTYSIEKEKKLYYEKLKNKVEYAYFKNESFYTNLQKNILEDLLSYCTNLVFDKTYSSYFDVYNLFEMLDSCLIQEFFTHMQSRMNTTKIVHPVNYWRKCFINYLKNYTYSLATIT